LAILLIRTHGAQPRTHQHQLQDFQMPAQTAQPARQLFNKVPEVTLYF